MGGGGRGGGGTGDDGGGGSRYLAAGERVGRICYLSAAKLLWGGSRAFWGLTRSGSGGRKLPRWERSSCCLTLLRHFFSA